MIVIDQSASLLAYTVSTYARIENAGRTCYKSEPSGEPDGFVTMIMERGHLSVIEHANATVRFVTDRGVTHELVRHRLASYSQESTRWCNYSRAKFNNQVTFIRPVWITHDELKEEVMRTTEPFKRTKPSSMWYMACCESEDTYLNLLSLGWKPEQARTVLNNSLKTEIVMTANFREWMHVFEQRCAENAHPQMRDLMIPLYDEFVRRWPEIFNHVRL